MYNGDADDDDDVQDVDDKVQQIRSQLSELATQNETLRRDFQALSATCRHTEVTSLFSTSSIRICICKC